MTWSFNTNSRYHSQDTGYYCGAACAMMVLSEIGVPYTSLDQDDLYDSNHNHNTQAGWATDPNGLRFTMVDRRPAGFPNTFVVYKSATEADGSRKLVHTLHHYQVSPIVLVYHCQHWIVVRGVQTDVDPAGGAYAIQGFWVNNPVFEYNEPHSATDVCGSGSTHGVENQWVSYATWQSDYFTGCAYDSPDGSQQFISVCDPEPPKFSLPLQPHIERPFSGRDLIAASGVADLIKRNADALGLHNMPHLKEMLRDKLGKPLLVKRLDRGDDYYYLSPALADGETIRGFGQLNARFGDLKSLFPLRKPIAYQALDRASVEKLVAGQVFHRMKDRGRFRLRPGTFCVSPTLVWRPCRESFSPHLPFWQITSGTDTVYCRIDGTFFARLTTTGRGT